MTSGNQTPPIVSIITVVFNGEQSIESTIKSVVGQTFDLFEYLVIDGASTDRTVAIIDQYRDRIDYFVSEHDKGIYDAMNKGVAVAKGEWIIFMNSGDEFA
jgi:glycosyltransferase involved in cell wall biosynthesis